jgi:hypothetical protein
VSVFGFHPEAGAANQALSLFNEMKEVVFVALLMFRKQQQCASADLPCPCLFAGISDT